MKPSICLVCLKAFDCDDLASEEDGNEKGIPPCGVPLLTRFIKFAENYLDLSSVTTQQLLLSGSDRKEAFCEKCELSVINPICQVYLELLSAQLRLSSELEHLGKLLDDSKVSGSDKLRVLNINALSNQLGIRSLSQLQGFRNSLAKKCVLKRKQALPIVLLTSRDEENDAGAMINELLAHDKMEKACTDPLTREPATVDNSLDLEQAVPTASGRTPIGTVIKIETFHQDSNPELNFENENDEEVNNSPSPRVQTEQELESVPVPVAENAETRINGILYNGHRCPNCSKVLKDEQQYQKHYRYYHIPMSCEACGSKVCNKELLLTHIRRQHKNRGSFRCEVCSTVYNSAFRLRDHMKRIHIKADQRLNCPHCDLTFRLKPIMKQHINAVHKPGKFPCPHCPESNSKVFTTTKYLSTHILQYHPQFRRSLQPRGRRSR
ncbi:unnamed protein product [Orchesella dallaii]|uniref:C2H2-type domain-containing protein n=1 Tax=Orchesella dallaii TaxID=48710 RepID=A0ABP1SAD0_9HEXA